MLLSKNVFPNIRRLDYRTDSSLLYSRKMVVSASGRVRAVGRGAVRGGGEDPSNAFNSNRNIFSSYLRAEDVNPFEFLTKRISTDMTGVYIGKFD